MYKIKLVEINKVFTFAAIEIEEIGSKSYHGVNVFEQMSSFTQMTEHVDAMYNVINNIRMRISNIDILVYFMC